MSWPLRAAAFLGTILVFVGSLGVAVWVHLDTTATKRVVSTLVEENLDASPIFSIAGGNSDMTNGEFSFGIRGRRIENGALGGPLHSLVIDRPVNEDPRHGRADLTGIEEDPAFHAFDQRIEVGILEDHGRGLAPKLHQGRRDRIGCCAHDDLTGGYRWAFLLAIALCVVSVIAIWIAGPGRVTPVPGRR